MLNTLCTVEGVLCKCISVVTKGNSVVYTFRSVYNPHHLIYIERDILNENHKRNHLV